MIIVVSTIRSFAERATVPSPAAVMPALRGVRRRVDAVCCADDGGCTTRPGRRKVVARGRHREYPRVVPRLQLRRRTPRADAQRRRRLVRDEQRRALDDRSRAPPARLQPRLLVDSHQGYQARCERDPGARTGEGLWQASEVFAPLEAWQALGQPTIAINANFFDVRGQKGGSWRDTKCSSPLGAYVDNTRGQGRANAAVTGTLAYAGKQGLSGGNEHWSSLATMIIPAGAQPYVVMPKGPGDYDSASPVIQKLLDQNARFVAVAGIGLLAPGDTGQLNDGGPSAARTAIGYNRTERSAVRLPGRQLHARPDPGSVPRTGRRQRRAAGRRRLVGDRVAARHRRNVEWRRVSQGQLRYPAGALRLPRARAPQLAGLQLTR